MIPKADITEWRGKVPWIPDYQVEQDLIITRSLLEIFNNEYLYENLSFRGGTALQKLYFNPPLRYSEDIDLVQINSGPIGKVLNNLQTTLNPILGSPTRDSKDKSVVLTYRMTSEGPPEVRMRLKVEINTREHASVFDYCDHPLTVDSRWCSGNCTIRTYCIEELLGTKMRALYQRRKGRDLFDLWVGINLKGADPGKIVNIFLEYMGNEGNKISKKDFEANLILKMKNAGFRTDVEPLISPSMKYNIDDAYSIIKRELIDRLT